jgi:uncharacterized YigZ family protein
VKIVKQAGTAEEMIKKSRFIGLIAPCQSERQAHSILHQVQQQHPNANHIVFAYRINSDKGLICRFYDAGEPSGTAGKPVFQHLEGKQLINLIVVVIRYFGGIKLGAGGLTRAYSNTAKKVIDSAQIVDFVEFSQLQLTLEYNQLQLLEYQLKKLDGRIIKQDFTENVTVTVSIPVANIKALQAAL